MQKNIGRKISHYDLTVNVKRIIDLWRESEYIITGVREDACDVGMNQASVPSDSILQHLGLVEFLKCIKHFHMYKQLKSPKGHSWKF